MSTRLGWTLLQFLWQGTVISIAFAVVRALMGRMLGARGRYTLACGTLGLMTAAPIVTFFVKPSTGVAPVPLPLSDTWLPWIVGAWLGGVLLFSIRLIGAWRFTAYLRRFDVSPVPHEWEQRLEYLMRRIAVSRPVQLLVSSLVEVPTVVGWLKPVILIPVSALTNMSAEHLEALLAHELAHIRRADYFVNILQSIAEAVLFYHPGIWWVSEQIRAERELCCDDLAVAASGDVLTYARALAAIESFRAVRTNPALAASGGSLLHRIRRLIGEAPSAKHTLPGAGAASIMSILWLIGIGAVAAHGSPAPPSAILAAAVPAPSPVLSSLLFAPYGPPPQPQQPQQPQ